MEKLLINFLYWLLVKSAISHYGKSIIRMDVASNSIKRFY